MERVRKYTTTNTSSNLPPHLDRERVINVEQVAALMNFSVSHIRRLYQTGKMPQPFKITGIRNGWRIGVIMDFIRDASQREVA